VLVTKIAQGLLGLAAVGFMIASIAMSCGGAVEGVAASGEEILVDCVTFGLCLATFAVCLVRRVAGWDAEESGTISSIYIWIFNTIMWGFILSSTLASAGVL